MYMIMLIGYCTIAFGSDAENLPFPSYS